MDSATLFLAVFSTANLAASVFLFRLALRLRTWERRLVDAQTALGEG